MDSIPVSPFLYQRREKEKDKTRIFINYSDFPEWASEKNCLISGSRGTGKSSILSSFEYNTQWFHYDKLIFSDAFSSYHDCDHKKSPIGVIFKCDRVEASLWERYSNFCEQEFSNAYISSCLLFSTYINLHFTIEFLSCIPKIIKKFFPAKECILEQGVFVKDLYDLCFSGCNKPFLYDYSVQGIIDILQEQSYQLRIAICSLDSFENISHFCNIHGYADDYISSICKLFQSYFIELEDHPFFLLMDDVDRLSTWQIKVINSLIKVCTGPCSYKLSSSAASYKTMHNVDNVPISRTDLSFTWLNDECASGDTLKKDKIDELYTAIFNMRLSSLDENGLRIENNLNELFGRIDIESTLKQTLKKSRNPKAQSYINKTAPSQKITDCWLTEKGIVKGNKSKEFDKYRVSAAFAITQELNLKDSFIFCSYEEIRHICSGSPRHFLRICNAMWPDIYRALKSNQMVPIDSQNTAIRMTSKDLYDNIDQEPFDRDIAISCKEMCDKISELIVKLVTDTKSLNISPECMSLKVTPLKLHNEDKDKYETIIDSLTMVEAIKVKVEKNGEAVYIALNPMLTPYYCIPFRSPFSNYYTIDINLLFKYLSTNTIKSQDILRKRYCNESELF